MQVGLHQLRSGGLFVAIPLAKDEPTLHYFVLQPATTHFSGSHDAFNNDVAELGTQLLLPTDSRKPILPEVGAKIWLWSNMVWMG